MKDEQLAHELARWMVCHVTADCLALVAEPPTGFLGIPVESQIEHLQWKQVTKLPWDQQDIGEILEVLTEAKLVVTNHRPLVSSYSRLTFQHTQRTERVLEQINFLKALDRVSKWEISQWSNLGYIELGFLSMQTIREALLTIFSTPKYYLASRTRLSELTKMGKFTSPI